MWEVVIDARPVLTGLNVSGGVWAIKDIKRRKMLDEVLEIDWLTDDQH